MKRYIAFILSLALLLTGCVRIGPPEATIPEKPTETHEDPVITADTAEEAVMDAAIRLFQSSAAARENTLISPLSILSALGMTANGAAGETRAQMQQLLGLDPESFNIWIRNYMDNLPDDGFGRLHLANGMWFRDDGDFTVEEDFLKLNREYFGAEVAGAPFDESTLREINDFVKENTDGMIGKILDQIPEESVMYLVNALAFEAKWASPYDEFQVQEGIFTTESGEKQEAELMYDQSGHYLGMGNAVGFLQYYEGRKFAFAALLPNEGVTVEELVGSLDAGELYAQLAAPLEEQVNTAIPKFETETTLEMAQILKSMGMTDAFDVDRADFSALGHSPEGNLFISRVLHKTYIQVAEQGTRAGAVTVVDIECGACAPMEEPKTVYLDRPFVYMIVDCGSNLPVFIGTCMDLG